MIENLQIEEEKQKLSNDLRILRAEFNKETDIRVRTSLRKYVDLLRNAQKHNEKINFPGGVTEMIKLAQRAKKMIEINRKPPPNLAKEDKEPYNSSRDGEVYADEAYKLKKSKTIFKDFMTQKNKNLQTRDFDANRYMTRPNEDKGLLKIERLASLLEQSGLGITEGPTIETSGPEG